MPKGQQWRERPADHIRIDPNDLRAETQYTLQDRLLTIKVLCMVKVGWQKTNKNFGAKENVGSQAISFSHIK